MFNFDIDHNVAINPDQFTSRLVEDTLERVAALHSSSGIGPNAFNGNSAKAFIDNEPVKLWVVSVNYPHESRVIGGSVGVVTTVGGERIAFTVLIQEGLSGGFEYEALRGSFVASPA